MKYLILISTLIWTPIVAAFLPTSFRAQYSQEEKSLVSGKIKKSSGTIEYRRPGRIRFEVTSPNKIIFVANPKRTWFYSAPPAAGEPGEVTISKGSGHPILKFFDALSQGLVDNDSYTVKKNDGLVNLSFSKKAQTEFNLKSALITMGKDYTFPTLKEISVTLSDGKTIKLEMGKLTPNVALPESNFVFEIPANTRQHRQ